MSVDDALSNARWQGGVDAKLDAVLAQLNAQSAEQTRTTQELTSRVDSLESFRDRAIGVMLGSSLGGGVIGGGLASLASYLIGS